MIRPFDFDLHRHQAPMPNLVEITSRRAAEEGWIVVGSGQFRALREHGAMLSRAGVPVSMISSILSTGCKVDIPVSLVLAWNAGKTYPQSPYLGTLQKEFDTAVKEWFRNRNEVLVDYYLDPTYHATRHRIIHMTHEHWTCLLRLNMADDDREQALEWYVHSIVALTISLTPYPDRS